MIGAAAVPRWAGASGSRVLQTDDKRHSQFTSDKEKNWQPDNNPVEIIPIVSEFFRGNLPIPTWNLVSGSDWCPTQASAPNLLSHRYSQLLQQTDRSQVKGHRSREQQVSSNCWFIWWTKLQSTVLWLRNVLLQAPRVPWRVFLSAISSLLFPDKGENTPTTITARLSLSSRTILFLSAFLHFSSIVYSNITNCFNDTELEPRRPSGRKSREKNVVFQQHGGKSATFETNTVKLLKNTTTFVIMSSSCFSPEDHWTTPPIVSCICWTFSLQEGTQTSRRWFRYKHASSVTPVHVLACLHFDLLNRFSN